MKRFLILALLCSLVGVAFIGCGRGKSEFDVAMNDLHDKLLKVQADFQGDVAIEVTKNDLALARVSYEKAWATGTLEERSKERWKLLMNATSSYGTAVHRFASAADYDRQYRAEDYQGLRDLYKKYRDRDRDEYYASLKLANTFMTQYGNLKE